MYQFNLFSVVDFLVLDNGLIDHLSSRGVEVLILNFFRVLSRSDYLRMVYNLVFSSLDINDLLLDGSYRLDVPLSNCSSSRNIYWYFFDLLLSVDDSFSGFLLSENRPSYFLFSDDGSLDYFLSDHRLGNKSLSNYWLGDHLLSNLRLRNYFLSLSDFWSGKQHFFSKKGFHLVHIVSIDQLCLATLIHLSHPRLTHSRI